MAALEVIALDTSVPQLMAPQAGDTYVMPRDLSVTGDIAAIDVAASGSITEAGVAVVAASDIGTAPNEIPLNQYLGSLAYQDATSVIVNDLSATGNVVLNDASTDTVRVNGYMGVGSAPNSARLLGLTGSGGFSGTTQIGLSSLPTGTSAGTVALTGISVLPTTATAAYTVADVINFGAYGAVKGAGSTITNQHGVYIADQTQGTNNYGITSLVSSGSNKWNIYASGTAANYFAGNVGIGTNSIGVGVTAHITGNARIANSSGGLLQLEDTTVADNSLPFWVLQSDEGVFRLLSANRSGSATTGSITRFSTSISESVFNDTGADIDFRVESDTNAHALFVEGTNSNVKVGGSAERATTVGTNHLDIFDGTAPVGTLSNGISIYSSAGEAYVMDAAGNATLFSPHDAETNEWIFKSKHTPTGKVLKIDVERLLRFVNDHFGLDAVQEFIEE